MVDHIVCEDDLMVFSLSSPVFALFLIYIIMLVRVLSSSIEPKKANDWNSQTLNHLIINLVSVIRLNIEGILSQNEWQIMKIFMGNIAWSMHKQTFFCMSLVHVQVVYNDAMRIWLKRPRLCSASQMIVVVTILHYLTSKLICCLTFLENWILGPSNVHFILDLESVVKFELKLIWTLHKKAKPKYEKNKRRNSVRMHLLPLLFFWVQGINLTKM